MRYMLIIKGEENAAPPSSELVAEMGAFNQALIDAGKLLSAEGLAPSKQGAKVSKKNGEVVVRDGPFAETRELVGGFWIIEAADKDEALSWARRVPLGEGDEIEVRRLMEMSDFEHDGVSGPALEAEEAWRNSHQR